MLGDVRPEAVYGARRACVAVLGMTTLAACGALPGSSHRPATSQLAFVNHLYAVIDRETAEAAERSGLLRACADFTVNTITAASGERWTGRYLHMRTTYVELFAPADASDGIGGPGSIGIAFSGDQRGGLDRLVAAVAAGGTALDQGMRRRALGAEEIDWFRFAGVPDMPAGTPVTVDVWAMEYVPSYFDLPAAGKRPSTGTDDEISRLRYNAGSYHGKLFEELSAAEFVIDRDLFGARVRPMLVAIGFRLRDLPDGVAASGDEGALTFRFAKDPGLRVLRFRLAESVDVARTEVIGRSTLTVGPGRDASWTFAPG